MLKRLGFGVAIAITLSGCGLFQDRFYSCNSDAARAYFDTLPKETPETVEKLSRMVVDGEGFYAATSEIEELPAAELLENNSEWVGEDDLELQYTSRYQLPGEVELEVFARDLGEREPPDRYTLWRVMASTKVDDQTYSCGVDLSQAQ